MEKLKNYLVPLVGLAVLGAWFFVFKPQLDEGDGAGAEASSATPASAGEAAVVPLDPLVEGDLGAPLVREVVEAKTDELLECYVEGLARTPEARGRILLRFVIRPEGSVRSADIAGSQVKDDGIGLCLAKKAATWEFPSSDTGSSTRVTYPLQLQVEPAG
jgi:hypothetical protein